MILRKWDYRAHAYRAFQSPAVKPALYSEDMELLVDCANCGKELPFGDCYTSKTIHTEIGFGYGVCEDCYAKEIKEYKKWN